MRPYYFDAEKYQLRGPFGRLEECSPCRAVADLLCAGVAQARQWRKRVRERNELARLDARALRDVGLTPCDIDRECAKPFWRK